ncbi:MAG: ribosome silencing factor [Paludibacteraceae bacterium]|nr:ribosome silencing factor [Paludibacteraceae bacterium]
MNKELTNEALCGAIVEGIRNKKGREIVVVNLEQLPEAPCSRFVIAEGGSSTQVCAIADEVEDYVRKAVSVKPFAVDGKDNAEWVAMDYGQVIVHIFQREARLFYDIEHLWEDGELQMVESD